MGVYERQLELGRDRVAWSILPLSLLAKPFRTSRYLRILKDATTLCVVEKLPKTCALQTQSSNKIGQTVFRGCLH